MVPLVLVRTDHQFLHHGAGPGRDPRTPAAAPVNKYEWLDAVVASELPAMSKLVAHTLAGFHNRHTGACHPSLSTIATRASLSRRSVITHITALSDTGWLHVVNRPGPNRGSTSNSYLLITPVENRGGGEGDSPGVVKEMHQGGEGDSPQVVKEMHPNPSKENPLHEPAAVHPHLAAVVGSIGRGMRV